MGVGFGGNHQLDDAVSDFSTKLSQTFDELSVFASSAVINLTEINASPDVVAAFAEVRDQLQNVTKDVDSLDNNVNDGNHIRKILIYISFALPGVVFVIALAAFLTQSNAWILVMMYTGLLTAAIMWLSFAVHLPVGVLMKDACTDANNVLKNNESVPNSVLNDPVVASCLEIQQAQLTGAQGLSAQVPLQQGTDQESIHTLVNFIDGQVAILQPQVDQMSDPQRTSFQSQINQLSNYSSISLAVANTISCVVVRRHFNQLVGVACDHGKKYLYFIIVADAVIGVFLLPALFALLVRYVSSGPPKGGRQEMMSNEAPLSPVNFQSRPRPEQDGVRFHSSASV
jgi:hypothetical protein